MYYLILNDYFRVSHKNVPSMYIVS